MSEGGTTALVTGASGFVGSHLTEALLGSGVRVRALLREGSSIRFLPGSPLLDVRRGALDDSDFLARSLEGVGVVYHLAAVTSAPTESAYFRANVHATEVLVRALELSGSGAKLVFCSTQAAAGPSREGHPRREGDPPEPISTYGRSKRAAEEVVLGSSAHGVVVRPPTVYGPRDRDILEMFRWAARGILPIVGTHEQQLSIIHVHDLVRALVSAPSAPHGSVYFVNDGEIHTRTRLIASIENAVQRRARRVAVPASLALAMAQGSRLAAAIGGWKPLLTPDRIREFMQTHWTCDAGKASIELGFVPSIGIDAGMLTTAAWYRENRWI